ncbi:DUF742 domain-containing protein [Actinacidiphila oryziradicis]|uniref:DUF742 domain-containing protein n=1 Tax=Actinacidiphila oryziradicis TaxID=2571141 RepID=A0A4U0RLR8_9ACTN|nr:DUF742 domain-containing protein [Actinacidiphila oryziradicis]
MTDPQRASHAPFANEDGQPLVRPYATPRSRTRYQLAIEALVTTTANPSAYRALLPEHQRICELCREVKAVAEVSALLAIPLGVARILIADLAEAGAVVIHQPSSGRAGGQPDVPLLERVLSGLRRDPDAEGRFADGYQALVDGLGEVLDVEAGLREALLQSHHNAVIDDLGNVLDVEAGLREALGGQSDIDT